MKKIDKPIRVLHLFANLNLGGAESRIMDLYRSQNPKVAINDFVIMTEEQCHFTDEILSSGGSIHCITNPRVSLVKNMIGLYRLLKREPKYDAIHAHTSYYSGFCVFVAYLAGITKRVTHARNKMIGNSNFVTKLLFIAGRLLCNVFATKKFAISTEAGKFLYGRKGTNFEVVANAFRFDLIRHKYHSDIETEKINNDIDSNKINIVCVARFYPVKNHIFLIKLFQLLEEHGHNCCLHLIGEGELKSKIELEVKNKGLVNKIRFWGKRSDVAQLLSLFDVMVMPSFSEGLGVAALEAQAAGLPCLLSKGIPQEADINAGLCKYISLAEGVDKWETELLNMLEVKSPSKRQLDDLFSMGGYTLEATRNTYIKAYSDGK